MRILDTNYNGVKLGFPRKTKNWIQLGIGILLVVGNVTYLKIER